MKIRPIKDITEFFNKMTAPLHAQLVTRTPVKMNKKDVATKTIANPFDVVYKIQTINVEINADYQARVNEQRILEQMPATFVAESRKWGEHVNGVIVEKDGKLYVNVIEISKIGKPVYEKADGTAVTYEEIAPFIPVYNGSPKQGVDEDVKVRTFKLENVIGLFIPSLNVRYTGV